jgi:uncharacterized protein YfaS (alpha-2-macroglobulin family)
VIDHGQARRLAAAAIDFALAPEDRAALDAHLQSCAACRSDAERLASDAMALAMLPPVDSQRDLRSSLAQAVLDGDDGQRPHDWRRWFRSRTVLALTAATVVVAIVAGSLTWWAGSRAPDGGIAGLGPTPSATSSGGGEPSTGPSPSDPPGGPVVDVASVAALVASGDRGGVVPLDASFRLTSLDGTPVIELAARVTVHPPLAMTVEASPDGESARLVPAEPLLPGVLYRFALASPTGAPLDSWAFQASQPIHVVSTLPYDEATDVPLRTGIEITFDQDGVTGGASHVTIEPAVKGRFEEHGRVLVFVPQRLAPMTIYTVTVRRGVGNSTTGQTLEDDVRFRFETAAGRGTEDEGSSFQFVGSLYESATAERPVISAYSDTDDDGNADPARIEAFRLTDLASAIDAYRTIEDAPHWSRWSTAGVVATKGLRRVLAVDAPLQGDWPFWVRLPEALPAGWYLVQHPAGRRPAQAVLQVTDVAGYLATSTSRSLVWANDLDTGRSLPGAAVTVQGGEALGTTDNDGLVVADTSADLIDGQDGGSTAGTAPAVVIRAADGRAAFLPVGRSQFDGYDAGFWFQGEADTRYWSLLHTDRLQYRSTDTVNVWGMLRERETGNIPSGVEVRLSIEGDGLVGPRPPLVSAPVQAGAAGVFTTSIPLVGVAEGWYQVELRVGDVVVETAELQVGPIAKPGYRLEIATGHRVYVEGDRIKATVRATFFEGSSVPGVRLRIAGGSLRERTRTTDRTGAASLDGIARVEDETGSEVQDVYASPARAEEGEINGVSSEYLVFPSRRMIEADGTVSNGKVRVEGSVHAVEIERLERELDAGAAVWDVDPRGRAVADVMVTARFTELIPDRRRVGTEYDFIAKQVVPVYETEILEEDRGTVRVRTRADGGFSVALPTASDNDYRVSVSIVDADGHRARADAYVGRPDRPYDEGTSAFIEPTTPRASETNEYGVGEAIDLTMRSGGLAGLDRYLFYVARDGLREAEVGSSARFRKTFADADLPGIDIFGVRFTGTTYQVAQGYGVSFRQADRALQVEVSPRAQRYAPGDQATLDIRTRTASGRPVSATVVLRGVDEKLFAIGAAQDVETLSDLYRQLPSGILDTYASHTMPTGGGEGGDTAGGGGDERAEFVDSLLFTAVETDAQGRGVVTFGLSDDLTSWHVSASAVSAGLEAGDGDTLVPVGLPFFVDASIAPEYLTADRPSIRVTAYGADLPAGARVTFSVESESLAWRTGTIRGQAFRDVSVPLPRLRPGIHTLTITASSGTGGSQRRDRLTRTFRVVESRLTRTVTTFAALGAAERPDGGKGLTTYLVSDAGRGRYLPLVLDLAGDSGVRLDQALAADLARSLLVDVFDSDAASHGPSEFSSDRYQMPGGGIALLPYAGRDLQLSAMAAIVAPDRFARASLEGYFAGILSGASETRERRAYALAGLAGLGSPVLPDIRAMTADPELTIRERLILGIGAAALGDATTARSIERSLTDAHLERLGSMARLRVGSTAGDITSGTALMAILAAWDGSPIAAALWDYVAANPSTDELHSLHAIAFLARTLERLPAQPATFAYSVAGKRHVVELDPGETFSLVVDRAQGATLTFESLSGQAGLAASWQEPARASDFVADPDVRISRSVTPSGQIDTGDLVRVDLQVRFAPRAATGCRQVTDLVPSGLAPLGRMARWPDDDEEQGPSIDVTLPYEQTGQRVFFCAEPTAKDRTVDLRYYARVVTPGRYLWEPAVAQAIGSTERATLTAAQTATIR